MPRAKISEHATRESRAKGGKAKAEKLRAERERRQADAEERFLMASARAIAKLESLLDCEDAAVALRAASAILDRALGKPTQRHDHGGGLNLNLQLSAARDELHARVARLASRHGSDEGS